MLLATPLVVIDPLPSLVSLIKSWLRFLHLKCMELPHALFERSKLVLCRAYSSLTQLFQHGWPWIGLRRLGRNPCLLRLILIKPMIELIGILSQLCSSSLVLVQNVLA
jgi:hypothetical protein